MTIFGYQNNPGFIINRTVRALIKALDLELRKNVGITFGQWEILVTLPKTQDGLTQKEIADKLGLEALTLMPIIDKLESDGFLERRIYTKTTEGIIGFIKHKKMEGIWNKTINCAMRILELVLADIPKTRVRVMEEVLKNVE